MGISRSTVVCEVQVRIVCRICGCHSRTINDPNKCSTKVGNEVFSQIDVRQIDRPFVCQRELIGYIEVAIHTACSRCR